MFFRGIFCPFFCWFVPWRRQVFREIVKDVSKLNLNCLNIFCICFTPEFHYVLEICLYVSTYMDGSLSFDIEGPNSSLELVVRGCFLMCLCPRRKIWTLTEGDIHRKLRRYHCQFGRVLFPGRNHAAVRKRVILQYLSNSCPSQGGTKAVKATFENKKPETYI